MSIYDRIIAYLKEHGFSQLLTYEKFTILPPDRRRGLFVHVMPGREHFCVCQIPQVVQSGSRDVGSEAFAFLSVREGGIDALELKHEAGLRALGADLVEYEATLAIQPRAEGEEEEESDSDDSDDVDNPDSEDEASEQEFDYSDWSHELALIDESRPERVGQGDKLPFLRSIEALQKHPIYTQDLLDALSVYVARCIPEGFGSHGRLWAVTTMDPLIKGVDDPALLHVLVNGFSGFVAVAPGKDSSQTPLLILLTVADGEIDGHDFKALESVKGFQYLKSEEAASELGVSSIGVSSAESFFSLFEIPGVIRAARIAALRLMEQKPSRKRPQPASNLALLDLLASRPRHESLVSQLSGSEDDYFADDSLDPAWIPDDVFSSIISDLAMSALERGDHARLVRAMNRSLFRKTWTKRGSSLTVISSINDSQSPHVAAYPLVMELTKCYLPEMVAEAVKMACHLAPAVEGKEFEAPLSFLRQLNGRLEVLAQQFEEDSDLNNEYTMEGAVFAGVFFTCDPQIMGMLESAWHRLSRQAQIQVFKLRLFSSATPALIDFTLARLKEIADSDDNLCGEMVLFLQDLPEMGTLPIIEDKLFWFNEPDKEFLYAENISEDAQGEITYAEYLKQNKELFDDIAALENSPKLMPDLIRAWRKLNQADLERRKAEQEAEEQE